MGLSLGAKVAVAAWVLIAGVIYFVADHSSGPVDEFERQVKARCELLGHEFFKRQDGALVCAKKQLARV